jgi:drug/metabolite transporter (DMT)-like permease
VLGILLALAAGLVWGGGDFSGGLAARRSHPLAVMVVSSFSGMLMLVVFALAFREGLPEAASAGWAAAAGLCGALAITALYRGLATGHMAQIAPVAAVITAAIPVVAGAWIEGRPAATQMAGFGAALLGLATVAGVGFGGFLVLIARVDDVFAPLAVARLVAAGTGLGLMAAQGLRPRALGGAALAWLAGCLDAGGTVFYLFAIRFTRLDVAAVLASMYPATTVALAWWLLSQGVGRVQWLGIVLCLAAVALMTM